ncbi:MAG TPA: ATPase [Chloroflexota bacterium]|nr:ATPase [Chloroflexota bacterium]HEX2988699.1 ATPase [Chloroflexota bacterium]
MDKERYDRSYYEEGDQGDESEVVAPVRRRRDPSEQAHARLLALMDELETIIDKGARIPFSSKVLIDRDVYLDAVDALRMTMPEALTQAERIVRDKERIIAQASAESERITSLAKEQAAFLISERQLLRAAETQSEAILSSAREESKEIISSAQKYASDLLAQLEADALRVLGEIRKAASQAR